MTVEKKTKKRVVKKVTKPYALHKKKTKKVKVKESMLNEDWSAEQLAQVVSEATEKLKKIEQNEVGQIPKKVRDELINLYNLSHDAVEYVSIDVTIPLQVEVEFFGEDKSYDIMSDPYSILSQSEEKLIFNHPKVKAKAKEMKEAKKKFDQAVKKVAKDYKLTSEFVINSLEWGWL